MISETVTISNKRGLHARAATKFSNLCNQYTCKMQVSCNAKTVDAKSIMSLMLLAAGQGTEIKLSADGSDEQDAMSRLLELINDKFGEGE